MAEALSQSTGTQTASPQGAGKSTQQPSPQNPTGQPGQSQPASNGKASTEPKGVVAFAQKGQAKESKPAPVTEAGDWGEEQEKTLYDLLKKSPHHKFKAGGKEVAIDSKEAWDKAKRNLERVAGINPLIEKTNAEKQQVMAELTKYKAMAAQIEAARNGDDEALKSLGIRPSTEVHKEREILESLPPEVRDMWLENQRLHEANQQREYQTKQAEAKAQQKQQMETIKVSISEIMQGVGYSPETPNKEIVLDVLDGIKTFNELGGTYGQDYGLEDIKAFTEEKNINRSVARLESLEPQAKQPIVQKLIGGPLNLETASKFWGPDAVKGLAVEYGNMLRERAKVSPLEPRPTRVEGFGQPKQQREEPAPEPVRRKFW